MCRDLATKPRNVEEVVLVDEVFGGVLRLTRATAVSGTTTSSSTWSGGSLLTTAW